LENDLKGASYKNYQLFFNYNCSQTGYIFTRETCATAVYRSLTRSPLRVQAVVNRCEKNSIANLTKVTNTKRTILKNIP